MLETPSYVLSFFLSLCLQLSTLYFSLHHSPFIHLAFILVISVFEFDHFKSQLEVKGFKSCMCGRILHPIFTLSFFKVSCSFQWCFSVCDRCVFFTDYLPMNMIKVTEHLCMFNSSACVSVLVCFCFLLLERHVYAYVFFFNGTIPYQCVYVILHCTLCPSCV